MHMSDALISPAVGAAGWITAAGFLAYSARRVQNHAETNRPALMGVLGAFVFAAQMVNFSIPGTGSSGHLGGGLLLAALLGPHAAFLVLASVLTVQALLFADGGLLALGCNIVNLGVFPCLVAYPLLFLPLAGRSQSRRRLTVGALAAAVVGLQLGALAVALETTVSGITELPLPTFLVFLLPVHLAIGLVEGLVTAGVLLYVRTTRPDLVSSVAPRRSILASFATGALLVGGLLSWFASSQPDGLEWSIARVAGAEELAAPQDGVHDALAEVQTATSMLPDYSLPSAGGAEATAANAATSLSGVFGAALTLLAALGIGTTLRWLRSRGNPSRPLPVPDDHRSRPLACPQPGRTRSA